MSTQKIKIITRLRPKIPGEIDDESIKMVASDDSTDSLAPTKAGTFVSVPNPRDPTQIFKFPFSSCYDEYSTQEELYRNDVEPLLDIVYSGVTVTIFAYGVTSSGKTHTMQGTKLEPGVIPRVVEGMFKRKHNQKYDTTLSVSYMEIYKDEVYDLFVTRETAPKLPVRENDTGTVFVANLSSHPIASIEEFENLYSVANKHRSVGSTNLNRSSSRSHAILTIETTMVDLDANTTLTGKIKLVDLAGSENNRLTGNDPSRMAESSAINKSLSVLGQVIYALNQGASRIPYRNSKLTRILQDALGGTSVGLLICNIAPGTKFRQDTLNTLNFAVRTKNVENRPVINERDNRPVPKPHFSAVPVQPAVPKPAAAILQAVSTIGSNTGITKPRRSMVPVSRSYRTSIVASATNYQPFAMPSAAGRLSIVPDEKDDESSRSITVGLSEKEINERISKAVEAAVELEVAKRLAEREKKEQREEEQTNAKENAIPSGVLTPLLRRHKDLDNELMSRLHELERKYECGTKETQLAELLSPVSKKKTGRAYVALARAHSEKGDLKFALELYRKAESYVPDNTKLKERIIEIEWAVRNNREYVPSPKAPRKNKSKKTTKDRSGDENNDMDVDANNAVNNGKRHSPSMQVLEFGNEVTNRDSDSPGKGKRSFAAIDEMQTPAKRQKRSVIEAPTR